MSQQEHSAPVPQAPPVVAAARVPSAAARGLQQRAELLLVRSWPRVRYQLVKTGPAGLLGLAVLLSAGIAALALVMPAHRSVLALHDELAKAGHALPLKSGADQTPQHFAASLPTRAQIPALLATVLAQANASGVVLEQGRYTYSAATSGRLARYSFEFPIKADYSSVRSFIDKTLAAIPALGLDKLQVERKNVGDKLVNADVGFVIYMRGT